jgi:hypothetical protein
MLGMVGFFLFVIAAGVPITGLIGLAIVGSFTAPKKPTSEKAIALANSIGP